MSIFEFDEEHFMEMEREYAYERGHEDGQRETLIKTVESAMRNLEVDRQKACEVLGISEEEYINAKSCLCNK